MSFSRFEEYAGGTPFCVSARIPEFEGAASPSEELAPASDVDLEVSPDVWGASVSPQVGDPLGSLSESEAGEAVASEPWQNVSFSSEFTLPSLPSEMSGGSPVSWTDVLEEVQPDPVRPGGYMTRAVRSRRFPGVAVDEALDTVDA